MKILVVVNNFFPEIGSAAHIYFDLARAFVRIGHEVDVITSYPRKFNLAEIDKDKEFPSEEIIDGITVHRSKHLSLRNNMILRGCEHFFCPIYYLKTYIKLKEKFDVCLIYIPPLPLYYFAMTIKLLHGTPSLLNYQDFHPQELTDVGILKNKQLINLMQYIETQSYKNADFITVLSEGGIDYILNRGGNPSKIEHIYNGCEIDELNEYAIRKDFKKKEVIEDKFLITYAGILSPFQGLDNVLNAAKGLKCEKDILFYLVGDGIIKDHLDYRIKTECISNVKLLPLQPRDEYLNIINSSDISLISLDNRMRAPCIPGKLINLMALKQPLIAIVPEESETAKLINYSKCGIVANPGNINELKKAIILLKEREDVRVELGENGHRYLKDNMNLHNNIKKYEDLFRFLIEKTH